MSKFAPTRTTYDTGDRRWLRDMLKAETHGVSVTTASFKPADIAADGRVKSGSFVTGEGLLLNDVVIKAGEEHLIAVVHAGTVDRRFLPAQLTIANEDALPAVVFINGTAPAA